MKNVLTFLHELVLRIPDILGKDHGFIARLLRVFCVCIVGHEAWEVVNEDEPGTLSRESTLLPPSDREDTGRAGQRDWPEPVCLEPQTAWDRKRTPDPPRGPSDRQNVGRVGSHDQAS